MRERATTHGSRRRHVREDTCPHARHEPQVDLGAPREPAGAHEEVCMWCSQPCWSSLAGPALQAQLSARPLQVARSARGILRCERVDGEQERGLDRVERGRASFERWRVERSVDRRVENAGQGVAQAGRIELLQVCVKPVCGVGQYGRPAVDGGEITLDEDGTRKEQPGEAGGRAADCGRGQQCCGFRRRRWVGGQAVRRGSGRAGRAGRGGRRGSKVRLARRLDRALVVALGDCLSERRLWQSPRPPLPPRGRKVAL